MTAESKAGKQLKDAYDHIRLIDPRLKHLGDRLLRRIPNTPLVVEIRLISWSFDGQPAILQVLNALEITLKTTNGIHIGTTRFDLSDEKYRPVDSLKKAEKQGGVFILGTVDGWRNWRPNISRLKRDYEEFLNIYSNQGFSTN